jgi:hypothetical protein
MSSSDPTYMDAINELQDIKNNFAYLNDQLNQFQEDSKQYALAADNDKISEGFKLGQADKFNRTAAMYTGNAKLNIQNGNLFFNVDGKDYNYSRGEIGDYSPKNFDAQVELVNLEEQIGNDALRGRTFDSVKSKYKGKITTFLKKNGKEGALSMVFDTDPEFITGGPSLQTPEILTAIAEDNFEGKTDENGNQIPGVYDLIEDQIMTGAGTVHASIYQAPPPPKDKITDSERIYAIDTDNIIAAASQMYSTGIIPDSLPGIGSSTLNTKQDIINAELEAQQAAIATGTLDEDDALTPEEIFNKYPAPYYTSDLRPVQNIRQALFQLYKADENQIKNALATLSNTEGYDASKLLFSTTPSPALTTDGNKLPPVPAKNEVTQVTQLRDEYAYGKNYLDSIEKLIDEAGRRVVAPRFRKTATKERNQKIQQIKELMQALKRDFPNLDLSNIKIPTTQQTS